MSSDDDYDAFIKLVNNQKNKSKSKYVDDIENDKYEISMDKFIVNDDSDLSERSSDTCESSDIESENDVKSDLNKSESIFSSPEDENSLESVSKSTDKNPSLKENVNCENKSSALFSSSEDENSLESVSKSTDKNPSVKENLNSEDESSALFSSSEDENSLGHKSSANEQANSENDLENLFSEDSCTDIEDISNLSLDESDNNNSFEFKVPSLLKHPSVHLNTPVRNSDVKTTPIKALIGEISSNCETKDALTTPVTKRKTLESLVKTVPTKQPIKPTKFTRLRAISSSNSEDESDENLTDSDSFIDDSVTSSNESSDDLSEFSDDMFRDKRYYTPTNISKMPKKPFKTEPIKKQSIEKFDFISSLIDDVDDHRRDADATMFRKLFNSKKKELAIKIYNIYNESVFSNQLPNDIEIIWSVNLRKTAGRCRMWRKRNAEDFDHFMNIELSVKVLTSADRLVKTLIHEMCHGACWMIDRKQGKHGPLWKAWTLKAYKAFPKVPISSRCHNYKIHYKFEYWCLACNIVAAKRHSKSLGERKVCGRCRGKLTIYRISAKGEKILVDENSMGNGFAKFVKENYGKHRKPGTTHADVMKKLSEEYKSFTASTKDELSQMLDKMNLS